MFCCVFWNVAVHRLPCMYQYLCQMLHLTRSRPFHRVLTSDSKDGRPADCSKCSDSLTNLSDRILAQHTKLCSDLPFVPPAVPDYCCMSGCANCVYLQYAVEMAECFGDNGATALKVIDAIEDETLRAFLRMEVQYALSRTP